MNALNYLHSKLHVIHRDVKPSNILINRDGNVKMCDFGISGYLVDSVAKTIDAGCKPYMAVRTTMSYGHSIDELNIFSIIMYHYSVYSLSGLIPVVIQRTTTFVVIFGA